MKEYICTVIGILGAAIAHIFGGWDASLTTLLIFMAIDYATGLIVAGVFHTSNKSQNGALESSAGWKGLARKCMTLLFVLIAHRLDLIMGTNYCKDGVCIGFITNELISIIENAGLMWLPIPPVIEKVIDILRSKEE